MTDLIVKDTHYLKSTSDFITWLNGTPRNITELCEKAREYLDLKSDHYKPATLSLLRVGLKKVILNTLGDKQYNSVYREAVNSAFRAKVPVIKPDKSVRQEKYLERFEVETLIKHCTSRVSFLVQFLFYTGTRINEATSLKLSDCQVNGQYVSLRIMGKGKKERYLSIPVLFYNQLKEFYQGEVYLFETRNHNRWNNSAFYRELKRQGIKILNKHVHPHMLRHSLCSYLLNTRNVSIAQVSKMLGHSSIKITCDMYHHGSPSYDQLFDETGKLK
jgi:integrase